MDRFFENEFQREPAPGYSLTKYGNVFALNCNEQFVKRLNNILNTCVRENKLTGEIADLNRYFTAELSEKVYTSAELDRFVAPHVKKFDVARFDHVFTMTFGKDFGMALNTQLAQLLKLEQVSPPMFSFAKQLEGCLFPKRKGAAYADE